MFILSLVDNEVQILYFVFSLEKNSSHISGFIYNFKDLEMLPKVSSTFMTFFFPCFSFPFLSQF